MRVDCGYCEHCMFRCCLDSRKEVERMHVVSVDFAFLISYISRVVSWKFLFVSYMTYCYLKLVVLGSVRVFL